MKKIIHEIIKKYVFKFSKILDPRYPYLLEPIQLAFLVNFLEQHRDLKGALLEVGVDKGMTTRFLCEHVIKSKIDIKYFVIDTFSSFTDADINYEVENRGKVRNDPNFKNFTYNNYDTWVSKFKDISFLSAIKCDCSEFNYQNLGPLKLVLLDVDLYLPTLRALEKIYKQLEVGGCIMVDNVSMDCSIYNGACEAYYTFCNENNIPVNLIGGNSGLVYKN